MVAELPARATNGGLCQWHVHQYPCFHHHVSQLSLSSPTTPYCVKQCKVADYEAVLTREASQGKSSITAAGRNQRIPQFTMASLTPTLSAAVPAAADAKLEWRAGFRKRLTRTLLFFRGDEELTVTQRRHLRSFARLLDQNDAFRQEIKKLSAFELEVLAISSTEQQLKSDLEHFTADEVVDTLLLGRLNNRRRTEVDHCIRNIQISNTLEKIYIEAKRNGRYPARGYINAWLIKLDEFIYEDLRVQDIEAWITNILNDHAILRLIKSALLNFILFLDHYCKTNYCV